MRRAMIGLSLGDGRTNGVSYERGGYAGNAVEIGDVRL
jgi:hypothetical protein